MGEGGNRGAAVGGVGGVGVALHAFQAPSYTLGHALTVFLLESLVLIAFIFISALTVHNPAPALG